MSSIKQKLTDRQRIEFAKNVEVLFESAYASWKRMFALSFLRGIATGLGIFLGGTIIVAVLAWFLSLLGEIPFINELYEKTQQTIEE